MQTYEYKLLYLFQKDAVDYDQQQVDGITKEGWRLRGAVACPPNRQDDGYTLLIFERQSAEAEDVPPVSPAAPRTLETLGEILARGGTPKTPPPLGGYETR